MAKIWLPLTHCKEVVVKENGRERILIIPPTGDRQYDEYIEGSQVEETRNELRKMPKKPIARYSKEEIQGALREYFLWLRKKSGGQI